MNLTETFSEYTVGRRKIEAAYFATQAPFGIEGCSFLCLDDSPISFAAKMRYKARSTFNPGRGKINVGKCGWRRRTAFGPNRSKGLNNYFVVDAIEPQAEVALGFQKRGEPIEAVQWHGWGKLLHAMAGNDVKI